jgi:hypothetical protein
MIPGLDQVQFFTNETIFDNDVLPEHLIILGAGPIGIEIGQVPQSPSWNAIRRCRRTIKNLPVCS